MKKILIPILLILVIGLGAYIIYDKLIDKNASIEPQNNSVSQNSNYTLADFDTAIDKLKVLTIKKSLNELENKEKLRILINEYIADNWTPGNEKETVSQAEIDKAYQKSVIKNLPITYENLPDSYGIFNWSTSTFSVTYDVNSKTFNFPPNGHGGITEGEIAYKDLVSFSNENGKYTIQYKYVFYNFDDDTRKFSLYYTVQDAVDKKNSFASFEDESSINQYIKSHYNEIKNKLKTYTYVFKIENDNIVITDFSVK